MTNHDTPRGPWVIKLRAGGEWETVATTVNGVPVNRRFHGLHNVYAEIMDLMKAGYDEFRVEVAR